MFGLDLVQAFREYKHIWDPDSKMNPGKLVDARPLDADLRIGADYAPKPVQTHFKYPDDRGSFAHATLRSMMPENEDFGYRPYLPEAERYSIATRWEAWWVKSREGGPEGG